MKGTKKGPKGHGHGGKSFTPAGWEEDRSGWEWQSWESEWWADDR
jgi:hypothetical protein